MTGNPTWIICRHVMNGSAEHVKLRSDKICLCAICADDIEIVNTEEVYMLDEDRLEFSLQAFDRIDGLEYIGKTRHATGRIIPEQRRGVDRRSGADRRLGGNERYDGPERRHLKYRRSGSDRRDSMASALL